MKGKIWLSQIPLVLLFTGLFAVYEHAREGQLDSEFLREHVYPVLQSIHGQHTNVKFRLRGPETPKNKIVIVEIDSDSIAHYGRWPWHRDLTANLIQSVFDAGAKAVGLDMVFSEPDQRVSPEIAALLKETGQAEKIAALETDQNLRDVITFNADRLTLGWTPETSCQPRYDSSPDCGAPTAPDENSSLKTFPRFAIRGVTFSGTPALRTTAFPVTTKAILDYPIFQDEAKSMGSFFAAQDADGVIRHSALLHLDADGHYYPSLPLELAKRALGEELTVEADDHYRIRKLAFAKSDNEIPVSPLGSLEVNFRGPGGTYQSIHAREVMENDDAIRIQVGREIASASKKDLLKDAIVLIGVSALGVFDMRAFPFDSNVPGVEGHANILDNLLAHDSFRHPGFGHALWLYFLLTVGALLFAISVERLEAVPALLLMVATLAIAFLIDQKLLFENHLNLNTSLALLEYSTIFLCILSAKYVMEERNKKFIKGAFAKYVSPDVIDSILEDPAKLALGGEKRELSILFSDIRSFTTFSEKMDAKVLAQFLNEYLGVMTNVVFDTNGTLDKYIGDAVMAFWGAPLRQPNHAAQACAAAITMHEKLDELRPVLQEKYGVDVQIGIGINSGAVNVGNMGSDRVFEYTVIGDHVNLASRLEGLTKEYHAKILTTRFTLDSILNEKGDLPPHRVLDLVKVKGKKKAIELIEIRERKTDAAALTRFEEARQRYLARDWQASIAGFREAGKLLASPDGTEDSMSGVFIERCEHFAKNRPPDDWDGAWVMTTK